MRWFYYGAGSLAAMTFLSTPVLEQSRTENKAQTENKTQTEQEGQKSGQKRLFLRLDPNSEYSFKVKDSTMAQQQGQSQGQQSQTTGQEMTYNLKVTDTSGGQNSLTLTISFQTQGAQAQSQGQQFDVKVGQDGEVLSVVPKTQAQQGQTQTAAMNTEKIKSHLEAILGSGLHRFDLEKDKAYHLTSRHFMRHEDFGSQTDQSGATGGAQGQDQQAQKQAQQQQAQPTATPWSDPLRHVALRFEKMTKESSKDAAQFTVVVPPTTQTQGTTPPGVRPIRFQDTQNQARNVGEGQESARPFDAKAWKSAGRATFSAEDGLCLKLDCNGEVPVTQDASRPATPTKFQFSVQREQQQSQGSQKSQSSQQSPKR